MARERVRRKSWRDERILVGPTTKAPSRGTTGRIVALVLVLAIVGVIGGLLYYLRPTPRPLALAVAITQYADRRYPPNPWAQQDAEAFRRHFDDDSALALQGQEKQALKDLVASLAERSTRSEDRGRPLVLYLTALSAVYEGRVFLLPGRAESDDPTTWLPLNELLSAFAAGQGPRLLILDIARPLADARLGLLGNPVSSVLHAELIDAESAGRLPFLVLTSCGAGEVAWASSELQRSVFGYFLDQGLLGHADGWGPDLAKDGRISARELVEFVRSQVPHWVAAVRAPAQTPQVYGQGKDFILLSPSQPFEPMSLPDPLGDYPKWLSDGWAERDQWEREGAFRLVPRTFMELQRTVWEAERSWLGGEDANRVQSELVARLEDLRKVRRDSTVKPLPAYSIAWAKRDGEADHSSLASVVRSLRDRVQTTKQPLKPDDLKPLQESMSPKEGASEPSTAPPASALARHTLEALLEIADPSWELLKEFDAILRSFPPATQYTECATLHFLANVDSRIQDRWNDPALTGVRQLILLAAKVSEEAVAVDPRVLPWLRTGWSEADELHRQALRALVVGGEEERREGVRRLREAVQRFEQLAEQARVLQTGWNRLEEAQVVLGPLAETLANSLRTPVEELLWRNLVNSYEKLSRLLSPPSMPTEAPINDVASQSDQIRFEVTQLRQLYGIEEAERRIRLAGTEGGPTPFDLWRFLSVYHWPAAARTRLFQAARDSAGVLAADAFNKAKALKPRSTAPTNNRRWPDNAAWRARLALDILRLSQSPEVASLSDPTKRAEADFSVSVQRELTIFLPGRFRKQEDLLVRERLGVLIHAGDLSVIPESPDQPPLEPTPERHRRTTADFARWLARERFEKSAMLFLAANQKSLQTLGQTLDIVRQRLLAYRP